MWRILNIIILITAFAFDIPVHAAAYVGELAWTRTWNLFYYLDNYLVIWSMSCMHNAIYKASITKRLAVYIVKLFCEGFVLWPTMKKFLISAAKVTKTLLRIKLCLHSVLSPADITRFWISYKFRVALHPLAFIAFVSSSCFFCHHANLPNCLLLPYQHTVVLEVMLSFWNWLAVHLQGVMKVESAWFKWMVVHHLLTHSTITN